MISRADIVEEARTWLGTSWRHQGRLKGSGVDCAGLIVGVAKDLGIEVSDYTSYSPEPLRDSLRTECSKRLVAIRPADAKEGDVLLFSFVEWPGHLGILLRSSYSAEFGGLIHAYAPMAKVVEHGMNKWWWRHVSGAYRFPGVEE